MIKHGMFKLIAAAALVCLAGVGVKAQDVTSDSSSKSINLMTVASASLGAPAAASSKPARPAMPHVGNGGLDIFLGYSYLNNGYPQGTINGEDCEACDGRSAAHGYALSATYWLNNFFGLTFDFSGHNGSTVTSQPFVEEGTTFFERQDTDQDFYYFHFGPSVRYRMGRVTVFAHGLAGVARADYKVTFACCSKNSPFDEVDDFDQVSPNTGFSVALGGGADLKLAKHLSWRVAQMDYLFSSLNQGCAGCGDTGEIASVNNVRISTGIVFNID